MFLQALLDSGRVQVMDGAMGTQLAHLGLDCRDRANLTHPQVVRAVHRGYHRAGARVHLTCTFQANPCALARHGLEDRLDDICQAAICNARASTIGGWVLGDIGPIFSPGRTEEFTDREALQKVVSALTPVDGLLFETCSSPAVLSAVAFVQHRLDHLEPVPLLVSLTYHRVAGRIVTFSGHGPETYARHAVRHGVSALGVNCGKDMSIADLAEVLGRYSNETDLPLFVRPNAGTPDEKGNHPLDRQAFAAGFPTLRAAGAVLVGGCCGTTADHIAALATCAMTGPVYGR